MSETKSELNQIIVNLRESQDYQRRESDSLRRLIVDLVRESRTLKLRLEWLEEAAEDVVRSCPKHLPQNIVGLADCLGIEIPQEN